MIVEHRGIVPRIHPTAWVAPTAVVSGDVEIGDHVLVGPHTHVSGCAIGPNSFIATGSMVFNGARIGGGSEGKSRAQQYHEMMERYTRGLTAHREDRILREGGQP